METELQIRCTVGHNRTISLDPSPTRRDLGQNIYAKRGSRQLRKHVGNLGWEVATARPNASRVGTDTARTSGGVNRTKALAGAVLWGKTQTRRSRRAFATASVLEWTCSFS
jgi:hypothetical protein